MNNDFISGTGYKELGLAGEAGSEFAKVPPGDALYCAAQAELMQLTDTFDIAAQNRAAAAGLNMIRAGCRDSQLIHGTALRLHYAGRSREAFDLTDEFVEFLEWMPVDLYGMATYASRIGEWEEAAHYLLAGMGRELKPSYGYMFADLDLEPLYRHAAESPMDLATAIHFANPRLAAALEALSGREVEVDGILLREMPAALLPFIRRDLVTGCYSLEPSAPDPSRREFQAWIQGVNNRLASLASRGIARAQKMIMNSQIDFAMAAAKRGDFFAARNHSLFAIAADPACFEGFASALSPLGMAYFFDDIRDTLRDDANFLPLIRQWTSTDVIPASQRMDVLEECGPAGKSTTFWMLLRAGVARDLESRKVAMEWNIEVIRWWPDDPAAFVNLLQLYEDLECWESADLLLANMPPAFYFLTWADYHIKQVKARGKLNESKPRIRSAFFGQPDLGGLVNVVPMQGAENGAKADGKNFEKPVDQTSPKTSEQL
ncbi:MAG: hypothetical protein ACOYM3_23485 [Terrimicrobiaceae bacterium]